ncbi:YitT family protein [Clostridium baratii]|uniref:YitT family protein n=1 Tax=Clostridium baratii TaxID=1561 RepID=UPI00311A7C53
MKENIKEYLIITLGVILVAVAIEYFYAPNNLAAGGVSGLAVVITHYVPSLNVGGITLFANIFLFILAFILVGGDFGFKTIYASFGLSILLWFIDKFLSPQALTTDLLLASIFGTIITAVGLAMIFNINASTGGTDILAKILNKYTNFNIGIKKRMYKSLRKRCVQ